MQPAKNAAGTAEARLAEGLSVVRCPIHGIAYDVEREQCPECAKGEMTRQTPDPDCSPA